MMRKVYIGVVLMAGIFILNACNKDTDIFVPDPGQQTGPDSTWYSSITPSMPVNSLQQSLFLSPNLDSIEVSNGPDTINSAAGLQCIFPPYSCVDSNDLPVTGTVYIESYLLKNRGSFISMGLPTISNGNLLVSGGAFFIQLQQNNTALHLAANTRLSISYSDTAISQQMELFDGSFTNTTNGQFNWAPDTSSSNRVFAYNGGYEITSNNLNWINCDHFYGDTTNNNKTSLSITLPSNLTNANTLAYIVFNNMRSVMPMNGDAASKEFTANKIPAGLNVTIITISQDGNFYYLGQQAVVTTLPVGGNAIPSISITPARVSLNDIITFLNSL